MKQENKNIRPFEDLLRACLISGRIDATINNEREAELVFSRPYKAAMSGEKVEALLSGVATSLSRDTLGSLITGGLKEAGLEDEAVQASTGLSASLLDDIRNDMVFTNSIPVRSLLRLLKLLRISLDKANAAILATFDKLSTENRMFLSMQPKMEPVFRRSKTGREGTGDVKRFRTDESYLYQNREALNIYTSRLAELFKED